MELFTWVPVAIVVVIVLLAFSFWLGKRTANRLFPPSYAGDMNDLKWYRKNVLNLTGQIRIYDEESETHYNIWSVDGGNHWFSVFDTGDGGRIPSLLDPTLLELLRSKNIIRPTNRQPLEKLELLNKLPLE